MTLTDVRLRKLKGAEAPYRLSDGGGLCIEVRPNGSKLWRLAYRFEGKQKLLALGSYPETPLARAREKRQQAKTVLQERRDPAAVAAQQKEERRARAEDTFGAIADEFMDKQERQGNADATISKKRWLIGKASKSLGAKPIRAITASEILKPLQRMEAEGNCESARRMRAVIVWPTSEFGRPQGLRLLARTGGQPSTRR